MTCVTGQQRVHKQNQIQSVKANYAYYVHETIESISQQQ
jgi:hypothetical protein